MSTKEKTSSIFFKIWEDFSRNFDELQNISIENRKSDIGFSEFSKMTIRMRPWVTQIGSNITWGTWGVTNQVFFTDFFKKTFHIKSYNNRLYYNNNWTWTDMWVSFTSLNTVFTPMLLPINLDWSTPTEYTTPADSSVWERVKKAAWDTWAAANIGKILFITDNTPSLQAYRWAFATIIDYNATDTEYTLNWSWITTALKSSSKYMIFDSLWEYLQCTNGTQNDIYFIGKSDWSIELKSYFTWLATQWLRTAKSISASEFVVKQISYNGLYWTFNKSTLFYSAWTINNPFFYNLTTALSMPGSVPWSIRDLFVFKWRLIIAWSSYIAYYSWDPSSVSTINLISESYGMVYGTLVDVWVDWYFISQNKNIYSLKENLAWTTLYATDEGKVVWNYLKDFNFNICWGFDWKRLYFYWEKESGTPWNIVVFNIQYKFWSTYKWLSPSNFTYYWNILYIAQRNSDKLWFFDETSQTDFWAPIIQRIASKEITLDDAFYIKSVTDIFIWLDNYVQKLNLIVYCALVWRNSERYIKEINVLEWDIAGTDRVLWEWVVWESVLWWVPYTQEISYPIMKKINLSTDSAYIWKIIIEWVEWNPFFLNELKLSILEPENKEYFDPTNSI